jgi:hypothetical protein
MKNARRLPLYFVFIPFLCASAYASYSKSYEHSKVLSGDFPIRSACMMPAEGKLTKVSMKGGGGMTKESDAWSATLQNIVESHLKSAGVQTLSATDVLESGATQDEIRQVMLDVQSKYESVSAQIDKKPKDLGKSRFTLGDGVALLPCSAKADVLVFVKAEGQVLSGGQKAMGLLVTGRANSTAFLRLTMADAKTGEIVGFVLLANAEQFVSDSEKAYGHDLDKQFKKMKIGSTVSSPKTKAP